MPADPDSYVHRIGRTARAGSSGAAISFCDAEEVGDLRAIERTTRQQITVDTSHGFHAALSPLAANARAAARKANGPRASALTASRAAASRKASVDRGVTVDVTDATIATAAAKSRGITAPPLS
jgi:superfamily II DNA/RNA helicase